MTHTQIDTLTSWLDEARSAVFFGGAGVSTASGIPDFRSAAGLYASQGRGGRSPEYMLSHECLMNEPAEFFTFHRQNLVHPDAQPNRAHTGLAELERQARMTAVVTQNIDGLHQKAASRSSTNCTARCSGTTAWAAATTSSPSSRSRTHRSSRSARTAAP